MNCTFSCLVGFALICSMISVSVISKDNSVFVNFMRTLSGDQRKIYRKITQERLYIYIKAIIIGTIFGFISSYVLQYEKLQYKICMFVAVTIGSIYLIYNIHPKSDYMILHLNSKEQNEKWLEIYKLMKFRGSIGLILGIVGYVLISYSF